MLKEYLEGLVIKQTQHIHDYVQIYFVPSGILNIYNPYQVISESSSVQFEDLVSDKILEVEINTKQNLRLLFESGTELFIDMRFEKFTSPEGMELIFPDKPIVAWQQGD